MTHRYEEDGRRARALAGELHRNTRDGGDGCHSAHNPATADSYCAGGADLAAAKAALFRLCSVRAGKTVKDAHH